MPPFLALSLIRRLAFLRTQRPLPLRSPHLRFLKRRLALSLFTMPPVSVACTVILHLRRPCRRRPHLTRRIPTCGRVLSGVEGVDELPATGPTPLSISA